MSPTTKSISYLGLAFLIALFAPGLLGKAIKRSSNKLQMVDAEERAIERRGKDSERYEAESIYNQQTKKAVGASGNDISMAELDRALNEMMMEYEHRQGDQGSVAKRSAVNNLIRQFARDVHTINREYDASAESERREIDVPSKFHTFLAGKDVFKREAAKRSLNARLALLSRYFNDRERRNTADETNGADAPPSRLSQFLSGR